MNSMSNDRHETTRANAGQVALWVDAASKWLALRPVLVMCRYLRRGGAVDWLVVRSSSELQQTLHGLPAGTELLAFAPSVLESFVVVSRDTVDDAELRLASIDAASVIAVGVDFVPRWSGELGWMQVDRGEDLRAGVLALLSRSSAVYVGREPDYSHDQPEILVSAVVGGVTGPR